MPIEIRELHIKVTVNQPQSEEATSGTSASNNGYSIKNEFLIAECVDQVIRILQNKTER